MARLVGVLTLLLSAGFSSGCSMGSLHSFGAKPGFRMPAAGDSTDTSLQIGDTFPELQAPDLDGNLVTFNQQVYGDRYTLIVFWSTWCGFCMADLPGEVKLSRKYERSGLRVIGVNSDDSPAIAKQAVQRFDVPWLNVFEGPNGTITDPLGISKWPELMLLDSTGKVIMTSRELRAISVETTPDGTDRKITGLEWALRKLMDEEDRLP